jgi:hypothetical protein
LQKVGTRANGRRSEFGNELAMVKTVTKEETYGDANITAHKPLLFQIRLSDTETEATSWSVSDMECVANQLERENYGINFNEHKWFKKKFSIHFIRFECLWESIGLQTLWKTIKQSVIPFGYRKMHLVNHIL